MRYPFLYFRFGIIVPEFRRKKAGSDAHRPTRCMHNVRGDIHHSHLVNPYLRGI